MVQDASGVIYVYRKVTKMEVIYTVEGIKKTKHHIGVNNK